MRSSETRLRMAMRATIHASAVVRTLLKAVAGATAEDESGMFASNSWTILLRWSGKPSGSRTGSTFSNAGDRWPKPPDSTQRKFLTEDELAAQSILGVRSNHEPCDAV